MIENPKEELLKFLNQEADKTGNERAKREIVRKRLVENAGKVLEQYQQHLAELKAPAEEKMSTVIQPWWKEIHENGVFSQIQENIDFKTWAEINVSQFHNYWWPNRSFQSSGSKAFEERARNLSEKEDCGVRLSNEIYYMTKEPWRARFFIAKPGSRFGEFNLRREPADIHDGRFVALKRIEEPVSLEKPEFLIANVPMVVIDFAGQIENGSVWSTIEKSVKGLENW